MIKASSFNNANVITCSGPHTCLAPNRINTGVVEKETGRKKVREEEKQDRRSRWYANEKLAKKIGDNENKCRVEKSEKIIVKNQRGIMGGLSRDQDVGVLSHTSLSLNRF